MANTVAITPNPVAVQRALYARPTTVPHIRKLIIVAPTTVETGTPATAEGENI